MKRNHAALLRRQQEQLLETIQGAVADAVDELADAVAERIQSHAVTAAMVGPDELEIISALWPNLVGEHLLPVVGDAYDLGARRTTRFLKANLAAAVARYGEAAVFRVVDDARALFLSTARMNMVGAGPIIQELARQQLLEGIAAGESIQKLASRLRSTIQLSAASAERAARTNVIAASNAGSLAQARAMGADAVQHKMWIATNDSRCRPWHAEADGQTVPLNDPFIVGGEALDYPGDGSAENSANCRCAVGYVDNEVVAARAEPDDTGGGTGDDGEDVAASATLDPGGTMKLSGTPYPTAITAATAEQAAVLARPEQWHSLTMLEEVPTGDGRLFAPGAITWREPPFSLEWNMTTGDHEEATTIGSVTRVEKIGNEVHTYGVFAIDDMGVFTTAAQEAITAIRTGRVTRVSAEWDETTDADVTLIWPDEIDPTEEFPQPIGVEFTKARLSVVTLVDFPAWQETFIELTGDLAVEPVTPTEEVDDPDAVDAAVVAAAYTLTIPDVPPAEWFQRPSDAELRHGALTITDEGRVYGLLAPGGVPHQGRADRITVPLGVDYSKFLRGETPTSDGGRVVTGNLTMSCGHASIAANLHQAADHYDNTCSVFATVTVGEHKGNVWVAGALMPGVTADQVRRAMACQLSGDWRARDDGRPGRKLAAALLVPVPGFPTARARPTSRMASEDGELQLVASGMPVRFESAAQAAAAVVDRRVADAIARSVGRDPQTRARELAAKVRG